MEQGNDAAREEPADGQPAAAERGAAPLAAPGEASPGTGAEAGAGARGWGRALLPLAALGAGMVGLMLWLAGAFTHKIAPGPPLDELAPVATATAPVVRATFTEVIEQVGTVRSRYRADVASKLLAQVVTLHVDAGDRVTGPGDEGLGTPVATLDSSDLRAQLARAQAQLAAAERGVEVQQAQVAAAQAAREAARARLERARADFARTQALVDRGVATTEQLDQVRAARDVALAEVTAALSEIEAAEQRLAQAREERVVAQRAIEEAEVLLRYAVLRAPFAGIVTERLVEAGETVQPGQGVVRIEDPTRLELHAPVAESLAARLSLGQRVEVRIDAVDVVLSGVVREVAPAADPTSRTLRVKVSLPRQPGLVSGLFGRLRIPVDEVTATVIPGAAVRRVGQLDLVLVAGEDGKLRRRFVTLGRRRGERVEVLTGLEPGEAVALP